MKSSWIKQGHSHLFSPHRVQPENQWILNEHFYNLFLSPFWSGRDALFRDTLDSVDIMNPGTATIATLRYYKTDFVAKSLAFWYHFLSSHMTPPYELLFRIFD